MKKMIALTSALLLSSSLFIGCSANNAAPDHQGINRAGTLTTDRTSGFNTQNMRSDRNLESRVHSVLGNRDARVYVANNTAYVVFDRGYNTNGTNRTDAFGGTRLIRRSAVNGTDRGRLGSSVETPYRGTGTNTTPIGDATGGVVTGDSVSTLPGDIGFGAPFSTMDGAGDRGLTIATRARVTREIKQANPSIRTVQFITR